MALASKTPEVECFWRSFSTARGVAAAAYDVVSFDDNAATATELAELVVSGRKRATAGLLQQFGGSGEPLPVIGGYVVLVDGERKPRAIWRTVELRLGPLSSVTEDFAHDEGEGDGSRVYWLSVHRAFFNRFAARAEFDVRKDSETVFERFQVVWPVEPA